MKGRTMIFSVGAHVALATALLLTAGRKARHQTTAIAVVEAKAKKAEAKPPPPEPPPPPERRVPVLPRPRNARPAPQPVAAPTPAPSPSPAPRSKGPAPLDTGLTLGNADGPGLAVAGSRGGDGARHAPEKAQPHAPSPAPKKREHDEGDAPCTEEPTKPEPLARTEIEYTADARANGVEGRLVLRVFVGADGGVAKVDVLSKVDPALDAAAVAAVERWRFKPSQRCGRPVAGGVYTLARRFELGD